VATAAAAASNLVRRNGSSSRTLTCRRVRYTRPFVIRMRLSTAMHPRALRCCGISNAGAITIARSTGVTSIQDRSLGDRNFRRGDRSAAVDISCAVRVSSAAAPAGTILIVGGSPVSAYADGTFITLSPSVILDSKRRPGTISPLRLIALTQEIAGAGQLRSQLLLPFAKLWLPNSRTRGDARRIFVFYGRSAPPRQECSTRGRRYGGGSTPNRMEDPLPASRVIPTSPVTLVSPVP
jgi:hypothetical protein